jgi:hypothetical protein
MCHRPASAFSRWLFIPTALTDLFVSEIEDMLGHVRFTLMCILPAIALAKMPLDLPPQFFNDNDLTELYTRDVEPIPGPLSFGHKFMTGTVAFIFFFAIHVAERRISVNCRRSG